MKIASTEQKARLLDHITSVLKLTGDGKRNAGKVADILQIIKDDPDFVRRLLNTRASFTIFPITVDYGRNIESLVTDGKYDYADSDINSKHFRAERNGTEDIEVHLVHFGRSISTEDAIAELDKMGLQPAKIHELLTLGIKHPDLQREFLIIALGSVWRYQDGSRGCPCLGRDGSGRDLSLHWVEIAWNGICRFAAVRHSG